MNTTLGTSPQLQENWADSQSRAEAQSVVFMLVTALLRSTMMSYSRSDEPSTASL
jgi:hypothetical protein